MLFLFSKPCRQPFLRRWRYWGVGSLLLCFACGEGATDAGTKARAVTTAAIASRTAIDELTLLGDVEGQVDVTVFPQLVERVGAVHVAEGDAVAVGDPLVTLEPDLISGELRQANAALAGAEATRDRLALDLARVRQLAAANASPQAQVEQLSAELRTADAQVNQLRATRQIAGSRRRRTVVRAPVAGQVADVRVSVGDQVSPQFPLCRVVDADSLKIKVHPVERDMARLDASMAVTVSALAAPETQVGGRIARVSPVVDPRSRTGSVEVAVAAGDHQLKPGMSARVAIALRRRDNVMMVPAEALSVTDETLENQTGVVFVARNGRAQAVEVAVGGRYGDWLEIRPRDAAETTAEASGAAAEEQAPLRVGEPVVVEGHHWLRDDMLIRAR